MSKRIYVAESIAGTIINAGVSFAKESISLTKGVHERDKTNPMLAPERFAIREQVMQKTIGAVVMSIAGAEAIVNEQLANYTNEKLLGGYYGEASIEGRKRLAAVQNEGVIDKRQNALDKAQIILQVLDLPALDRGTNPVQDFSALIALRNALVHSEFKPRPHGSAFSMEERDALERRLIKRFASNSIVPDTASFIWQRCLGSGCAKWSAETACQFRNVFFKALGIGHAVRILWDCDNA